MTVRALFVCSQNRLRSQTAVHVFANTIGLEVKAAGLGHDAENPLSIEQISWADTIFVMERAHLNKISKKFREFTKAKRLYVLNIPDEYEFMDPILIRLLRIEVPRRIPSVFGAR